ncbi:hypothetical protein DFA_07545 [Cavenderia fasciculata]|uniref:Uncharacterized protein n=1 Tax=Cavenderia fasciculata TaxID=261658 RepID=F4PWQ7_CACFS|nr:uncharacterized protein DFA_07545 [Cavenderia fasciculata]EGG20421.1 hypothetical protein DFA_07545 [Cavenderia fasciculata]|eukprot:XP_004367404.1 hypothetical protein DFA_07545 [Cavenderia fasciculata]
MNCWRDLYINEIQGELEFKITNLQQDNDYLTLGQKVMEMEPDVGELYENFELSKEWSRICSMSFSKGQFVNWFWAVRKQWKYVHQELLLDWNQESKSQSQPEEFNSISTLFNSHKT